MASEKRLIDSNALKKRMCYKCNDEYSDEPCEPSDCVFYNAINDAPTVDAVEVVRCKDCKWYSIAPIDNVPYCCHESGYCGEHMGGLFFCACGERKDND